MIPDCIWVALYRARHAPCGTAIDAGLGFPHALLLWGHETSAWFVASEQKTWGLDFPVAFLEGRREVWLYLFIQVSSFRG